MNRLLIVCIAAVCIFSLPVQSVHSRDGKASQKKVSQEKLDLNFENTSILQILKLLSLKGNVNIVAGPEISADVSINLRNVTWQEALDILLATYGFGYDRVGNAIIVEDIEKLRKKRVAEKEFTDIQLVVTEVFHLKYLDANDVKSVIESQLSPQGKVAVLEETSLGWSFKSSEKIEKKEQREARKLRSNKLVVSDIPSYLEKIRKVLVQLDLKPRQILIQAKIIEVRKDFLKDIGFDWGTGSTGAESGAISTVGIGGDDQVGGQSLSSQVTPPAFDPSTGAVTGTFPYNTGLSLMLQKLSGTQFQIIFHAIEENADSNILSAPHILTLDGHEATILVGTKYPILKSDSTGTDTTTVTASLDYYQDIGIQLNVIPKIAPDDTINMVIHPAITDFTETLKARGSSNQVIAEYPIIQTREAETNVYVKNGETIVVGGLLKEVEQNTTGFVPLLGKIPILGHLFRRDTRDRDKIDLLIFITAHIVENPGQVTDFVNNSSPAIK